METSRNEQEKKAQERKNFLIRLEAGSKKPEGKTEQQLKSIKLRIVDNKEVMTVLTMSTR